MEEGDLMTDMETAIGKLVTDKRFRKDLFANPESTLRRYGLTLSKEDMAKIKKASPDKVEKALAAAQDAIGAAAGIAIVIWDV